MKQKLVGMILCLAMAVTGLTGCGGSESNTTEETPQETAEPTESEEHVVGFLEKNEVDVYHVALNAAVTKVLEQAKEDGVIKDFYKMDGASDPIKQNDQMEQLINLGCTDFICIFAEGDGCMPIVERAAQIEANLVNVDSMANNIDDYEQFVRVNPDNTEAARMQAEYVMSVVPDGGGYCILGGISGNTVAVQRHDGVRAVLDEQSGWTLLDEQWADWDPEKSVKFTEDWLSLYGDDLKAIFCGNDTMAIAAAGACNAAGRDDIKVVGIDAIESAISMIENGEMAGTIWQDSNKQATTAAEKLIELIQGKEVDHYVQIENTLITKDNTDVWHAGQPQD